MTQPIRCFAVKPNISRVFCELLSDGLSVFLLAQADPGQGAALPVEPVEFLPDLWFRLRTWLDINLIQGLALKHGGPK